MGIILALQLVKWHFYFFLFKNFTEETKRKLQWYQQGHLYLLASSVFMLTILQWCMDLFREQQQAMHYSILVHEQSRQLEWQKDFGSCWWAISIKASTKLIPTSCKWICHLGVKEKHCFEVHQYELFPKIFVCWGYKTYCVAKIDAWPLQKVIEGPHYLLDNKWYYKTLVTIEKFCSPDFCFRAPMFAECYVF